METGEATASKRIPWDADNTTPNGPTSLDVLLLWILTPGKYERLQGEHRSRAFLSILTALKKQGLHHRTESGIRGKVRNIENRYIAAKRWLDKRNIDGNDIITAKADNATVSEVLSICPQFNDLYPVFRHSSVLNEAVQATNNDEITDSDERPKKLSRSKPKRKAKSESQRPRKRQNTLSTEVAREVEDAEVHADATRLLDCVRRTTGELDLSGSPNWFERTDHCELVVRDSNALLPPEFHREVADAKLDHLKKQNEGIRASDVKKRDEMLKCEIEVKRGRGKVQLILEKMLARQAMGQAGVSKEEVDQALPLKE